MKKQIITISRSYGSGGREVGRQLAQRLGTPFYDKEIIEQVASRTGFEASYVENRGEYAPSGTGFGCALTRRNIYGMSPEDFLWTKQREVILELAGQGPCVIVGRCADYILKDRDDCLNVFIHASLEKRRERVLQLYGDAEEGLEKRLQDRDKKRRRNYQYYTQQEWGMAQNYHITMDSGALGIESCVDILCALVK